MLSGIAKSIFSFKPSPVGHAKFFSARNSVMYILIDPWYFNCPNLSWASAASLSKWYSAWIAAA